MLWCREEYSQHHVFPIGHDSPDILESRQSIAEAAKILKRAREELVFAGVHPLTVSPGACLTMTKLQTNRPNLFSVRSEI